MSSSSVAVGTIDVVGSEALMIGGRSILAVVDSSDGNVLFMVRPVSTTDLVVINVSCLVGNIVVK
jgi:hypothetical protein